MLCEGGLGLARSLADEGLVDEWITVLAPIAIGNRPLAEARRFSFAECSSSGPDIFAAANLEA